jgi:hypothetical protein
MVTDGNRETNMVAMVAVKAILGVTNTHCVFRKVLDSILYVLRTGPMENASKRIWFWFDVS